MKNSILCRLLPAALFVSTLLASSPIYSMQLNAVEDDSSDETESLSEEHVSEQPAGWGVRTFIDSQVTGVAGLLSFGRGAASSLYAQLAESKPTDSKQLEGNVAEPTLVNLFLTNHSNYKKLVGSLARDVRCILSRYLLSGHPFKTIILQDLMFTHFVREFNGHESFINSAKFNDTGVWIVTSSADRTVKIWDTELGTCIFTLEGHDKGVLSAKFNKAGSRVITCSEDWTAKVWNVESGKCIHTLKGHEGGLNSVQINEVGDTIITASCDRTAKVWNSISGKCNHTLAGHEEFLYTAKFNRAAGRIVTASGDNTAKVWDVLSGKCINTLVGHENQVISAKFNKEGTRIVTCSKDRTAKIWDAELGNCIHTLVGHEGLVFFASFNKAGTIIATASWDGTAKIWDALSGKCINTLGSHMTDVNCAKFSRGGDRLVTGLGDGAAKIWDIGRWVALLRWFDRDCSLEQALLLHCIFETHFTQALLKKRNPQASLRFDFNTCPHLQEYFDTMPVEIQACLEPFVIKKV